jgi:hypothetical protein
MTYAAAPLVPSAPYDVQATAQCSQVLVTWCHTCDNGCGQHTVMAYTGGVAAAQWMTTGCETFSATITGLTNGTAYTFTVKSANNSGWSPESAPSNAVTPAAATVTATQGGSTTNGILLHVTVLTGAAAAAAQTGATAVNHGSGGAYAEQSIVTTATGSLVYGAMFTTIGGGFTPAAGTSILDNLWDSSGNVGYGNCVTTAPTGTPGTVTVGSSLTGAGRTVVALAEILPAAAITTSPSAPAPASTYSDITVTTASFTPPSGSLVVALVSSNGGGSVTTMTVAGGGLQWAELVKTNASSYAYAGVWAAQM